MLDEGQRTTDIEPEPSATLGDQSQDLRLVREAAAQQNQPGLEVVLDIRQLEAVVESNLAGSRVPTTTDTPLSMKAFSASSIATRRSTASCLGII